MRVVFAGTPAVAVPSLDAVHAAGHRIVAVITREDAPTGRKRVLTPSPVAQRAAELGLPVIKTNRLDASASARIAELAPDLGVIVAYGGLVREPLLSAPVHGWINLHFSALPDWRGAAPVQRAIMNGDTTIGVTVFQLVEALDAGDVWLRSTQPLDPDATAGEVLDELAGSGSDTLVRAIGLIGGGSVPQPQEGQATYAHKLGIADGALDLSRPVEEVYNRFRGVTPEPGAHVTVEGQRFKILAAHPAGDEAAAVDPGRFGAVGGRVFVGTATAPLELARVQPSGKPAMAAADWWRGLRDHGIRVDEGERA